MGQGEGESHRYNQQCEKNEVVLDRAHQPPQIPSMDLACYHVHTARKDDNGDQASGGDTAWTNTGEIRSGTAQDGGMLRRTALICLC